MWKDKSIDKIFKYFGYDVNGNYSSDEQRAEVRNRAITAMKTYGQIPDDVMDKVVSYSDEQLKREEREKERRENERRRLAQIAATKASNREQQVFEDDDEAKALFQHLVDNGDIYTEDIEEKTEKRNELTQKLEKLKDKFQKLKDSKTNNQKVVDMMVKLEVNIDAIESEIDELNEEIEENDIYGVVYEEQWDYYGLRSFETPYGEYAVGTEDDAEEAAKQYLRDAIDSEGVDMFSSWVIENNINKGELIGDIKESQKEYYEEEVRDNLGDYFDDYDEDDEETHPSEEEIDDMIESLASERAEDIANDMQELEVYGYNLNDYVDIEGMVEDIISHDGIAHSLSTYDGTEENVQINGTWYNIYRIG